MQPAECEVFNRYIDGVPVHDFLDDLQLQHTEEVPGSARELLKHIKACFRQLMQVRNNAPGGPSPLLSNLPDVTFTMQ